MTLGSHQRTIGTSQVHITPRRILDPLGAFDLDPCGNDPRPWDCAALTFTEADDGLARDWFGRVWLNPPFDRRVIASWFEKMAGHNRGTALVHARTETAWFSLIWRNASAVLFLAGRVVFHKPDGSQQTTRDGKVANSGAPVVLAAFGARDCDILAACGIDGQFVPLVFPRGVLVAALADRSWRQIVTDFIAGQDAPVRVADLYRAFSDHPKSKVNPNWRAKLRQTLQRGAGKSVGHDQWVAA